ncbi:putative oxidoreductase [metagenome]|uniref:Putative oxidoreductase n=1 Tax=metagenome TaxID=256318 RepID=A0A2P2C6V5_9ZZZZ
MDLDVQDKVYLVTGGARGLGRAAADQLVADGARVLISGREAASLDAATAELGDRCRSVVADNADPSTPQRLIQTAQDLWGRLDGILISVGGPPAGAATQVSDEQWMSSFETVFLGAVRLSREVARVLPAGGTITFVLSSSVRAPLPGLAVSNGLRPGLAMYAKDLADELGPSGIRVNGLLPGRIATERLTELDAGRGAGARERAAEGIPLRRDGQPAEFGRTAAFLMSPASSFVNGVMLPVDGGMLRAL